VWELLVLNERSHLQPKKTVLVVDDDPNVIEVVVECLESGGYLVLASVNGTQALEILDKSNVDLVIVDLGLPDIDGLELTRSIKTKSRAGIIILSGRTDTTDKVVGLEIGADDYLTKPFELRELLARVRSVLRRKADDANSTAADNILVYEFDGWIFNLGKREVASPAGSIINLTSGEFDLLSVFVENPNSVLSRDQISDLLATDNGSSFDRSIDLRINRLRKKLENIPKEPKLIKTVRNAGYKFVATVSSNV